MQTFHFLVSSMLVNVYLNISVLIDGGSLYSEAATVSYRMTFSVVMLFSVFFRKYAAGASV